MCVHDFPDTLVLEADGRQAFASCSGLHDASAGTPPPRPAATIGRDVTPATAAAVLFYVDRWATSRRVSVVSLDVAHSNMRSKSFKALAPPPPPAHAHLNRDHICLHTYTCP
eukprot:gene10039-263_t